MELLLVGNGRSVLSRRDLGVVVDAFSVVVPFNNFMTTGYEEYIETKTDWWARNETPDVLPRTESVAKILLRLQGEEDIIFQEQCATLYPQIVREYPRSVVEVIPQNIFQEVIKAVGMKRALLTGTLVAAHLLQTHPRVHICGFDNLTGGESSLRHYYSEENIVGDWTTYHETDKESAYLNALIDAGRIVVL